MTTEPCRADAPALMLFAASKVTSAGEAARARQSQAARLPSGSNIHTPIIQDTKQKSRCEAVERMARLVMGSGRQSITTGVGQAACEWHGCWEHAMHVGRRMALGLKENRRDGLARGL